MKTSNRNKIAALDNLGITMDLSRFSRVCLSDRRLSLADVLNPNVLNSDEGPNSLHEGECFC